VKYLIINKLKNIFELTQSFFALKPLIIKPTLSFFLSSASHAFVCTKATSSQAHWARLAARPARAGELRPGATPAPGAQLVRCAPSWAPGAGVGGAAYSLAARPVWRQDFRSLSFHPLGGGQETPQAASVSRVHPPFGLLPCSMSAAVSCPRGAAGRCGAAGREPPRGPALRPFQTQRAPLRQAALAGYVPALQAPPDAS